MVEAKMILALFLLPIFLTHCTGLMREKRQGELAESLHKLIEAHAPNMTAYYANHIVTLQQRITKELEETFVQLRTMVLFALKESMFPQRCAKDMTTLDSVFFPSLYATIYPNGLLPITFPHYCYVVPDSGGWVVIQRRVTGSVSFNRTWTEYKHGFGSFDGDFWLGNEKIHEIASSGWYEMRVEMTFDGIGFYAYFKRFIMMDESMSFKLIVGKYSGTAGNSLKLQSRQSFSTPDKDNDKNYFQNCAKENTGGWWFTSCLGTNLNGQWGVTDGTAMKWDHLTRNGRLTFTEMKIRYVKPL